MKKTLIISAALMLMLWALLFFVARIGAVAHILLAVTGIIVLFVYSLRKVLA